MNRFDSLSRLELSLIASQIHSPKQRIWEFAELCHSRCHIEETNFNRGSIDPANRMSCCLVDVRLSVIQDFAILGLVVVWRSFGVWMPV